jgi:membrane protein DedA with SNARE-associated domain
VHITEWLEHVPALLIYLMVGGVIGIESLGIPLPGEIVLVSAALLSASAHHISPLWIGVAGSAGAIIGDSIGYAIGRKGGKPLLAWLGRKFPKHFGPEHVAVAERVFGRWGMFAVFFGRFIALLRIFAGPLSGVLHMPYWKFLIANALGGIIWAGGTTAVIYYAGQAAEKYLSSYSWIALGAAVVIGLGVGWYIKHRTSKAAHAHTQAQAEAGSTEEPVLAND